MMRGQGRNPNSRANPPRNNSTTNLSGSGAPSPPLTSSQQRENLTVNTNVAAEMSVLSPGVRDVAEHAAQLQAVLGHLNAISRMVGEQASNVLRMSPAVLGGDQVVIIRKELVASQEEQRKKMVEIVAKINREKLKLLDEVNEKILAMIKEVVAVEVRKRVEKRIRKYTEQLQYTGLEQEDRRKILHQCGNIDAKNRNATIRSKWPNEPIHKIARPLVLSQPPIGPSLNFPEDFQTLRGLTPQAAKALMEEYGLVESDKQLDEDRHLDNLNRLMSHFGIGYRLIPAGPVPFLTSVWDRR